MTDRGWPEGVDRARIQSGLRFRLGQLRYWLHQRLEGRRLRRRGVVLDPTAVVANVEFRGPAEVGARCRLTGNPRIVVGRDVRIGPHVHALGDVELGDGVELGARVILWCREHGIEPGIPVTRQPSHLEPIRVEAGARIGPGATVLRGVQIGAGARVGAGAVCTRDVAAGAVVRGAPARPVDGSGGA